IRPAAADIAAHALAYLFGRSLRPRGEVGADEARDAGLDLAEHRHGRADLPGRAIAALVAIVLHEGSLHRVQAPRRAEPLDSRDRTTLLHDCQRQARKYP